MNNPILNKQFLFRIICLVFVSEREKAGRCSCYNINIYIYIIVKMIGKILWNLKRLTELSPPPEKIKF